MNKRTPTDEMGIVRSWLGLTYMTNCAFKL